MSATWKIEPGISAHEPVRLATRESEEMHLFDVRLHASYYRSRPENELLVTVQVSRILREIIQFKFSKPTREKIQQFRAERTWVV